MTGEKTRKAPDVISGRGLDFDRAYEIIYSENMDPGNLSPQDIERLQKVAGLHVSVDAATGEIIVLRDPQKSITVYALEGSPPSAHLYDMKLLLSIVKGEMEQDSIKPVIFGGYERQSSPGQKKAGKNRSFVTEEVYMKILENLEELLPYLYAENRGHGTKTKGKPPGSAAEKVDGYNIEGHMGLQEMFSLLGRSLRGRVSKEIYDYLQTEDAKFLDGFDFGRFEDENDAPAVIKWFESMRREHPPGFYISALAHKHAGRFEDPNTPRNWIGVANNYSFSKEHGVSKSILPKKATTEDFTGRILEYYVRNPHNYLKGDATRLFDGLYAQGRITDDSSFERIRLVHSGPLNYLLSNFKSVDSMIRNTVERVRQTSEYGKIDRSEGTNFEKELACVVDHYLTHQEKNAFESMRASGSRLSNSYRRRIIELYLTVRGDALFPDGR